MEPGRLMASGCLGDRRLPPEKGTVPFSGYMKYFTPLSKTGMNLLPGTLA